MSHLMSRRNFGKTKKAKEITRKPKGGITQMTTDMKKNEVKKEDIGKEIVVKFEHGTEMVGYNSINLLQMPVVIRRDEQGNEFQ